MHLVTVLFRSRFRSQRASKIALGRFVPKETGDRARKVDFGGAIRCLFQPLACFSLFFSYVTWLSFAALSLPSYSFFLFLFPPSFKNKQDVLKLAGGGL